MTDTPISTLGELRASGHVQQAACARRSATTCWPSCAAGEDPWPGLHGFDDTVIPQLERALIAGHDVVLLGERGQGKTRLLRTLVGLLDEWTPVIAGSELGEHPYEPITPESRRRGRPSSATRCRSPGGTATSGTPRSSPPPTPASPT